MTCRDIMTANPTCCTPDETAAKAARIMQSENVGPVPVVEDQSNRKLVGIVTDRDLALQIVASGRDGNSVKVSEVMSPSPITCAPDDDASTAMNKMATNQIRRVPVIDRSGKLVGIISQADVALNANDEEVGNVVEEISEGGWGSPSRMFRRSSSYAQSGSGGATGLLTAVIGLGVGAGLMYLLDPDIGRRRRAITRDKAINLSKSYARDVRDLGNKAATYVQDAGSKAASYVQDKVNTTTRTSAATDISDAYERGGAEYRNSF